MWRRVGGVLSGGVLLVILLAHLAVAEELGSFRNLAPDQPGEDELLNRELWQYAKKTPYADAERHVARTRAAARAAMSEEIRLPNGWRIAPPGTQVEVGRFPHEAVAYAGRIVVLNTGYYWKEPQEVSVVDPDSGQVVKVIRLSSIFPSAQVGEDGDLYLSGGISGKVFRFNQKFETVREYQLKGYAAGLAAVDASHLAVIYMVASENQQAYEQGVYGPGKVVLLNTSTGEIEREVTVGYFPHSIRRVNGKLWVTLLGEDQLKVYDTQLNPIQAVKVGRAPQDLCGGGERLYVVNTGSDSLTEVDTRTQTVTSTIALGSHESRFGIAPMACTVEAGRIYVTQASTNSVAVLDQKTHAQLGQIPTGWYPTKVLFHGQQLFLLSAKGIHGRRPNVDGPQPIREKGGSQYVLSLLRGALSIVPTSQVKARLAGWTRMVRDGSPIYSPRQGFKLPIRHIFYIVRENRTYDQVLGDLGRANGDPYLTLFGREITPNAHRLAEEFVTLDNYYANGEVSVLGHSYTTSGYASPFLQWLGNARYSGRYAGYPFGMVPAVTSPAYLWDALDEAGVDYRIYGENYFLYTRAFRLITETFGEDSELARKFYANMMSLASKGDRGDQFYAFARPFYGQADTPEDASRLLESEEFTRLLSEFLCGDASLATAIRANPVFQRQFAAYLRRYPFNYRSWDLKYSDLERARAWKIDFEKQLELGRLAQLHYIWLPNDHTGGTAKEYLPPDQLVAQNDAALGIIIDAIARSPVWKESLILVTEDDAQDGPDHVDATRTVALAIGPYVKRNSVVKDRYDQLSMLRTIELLLGLKPLNASEALAVPMFSIFTPNRDMTAPGASQASSHLIDSDRHLFDELKSSSQR